VSSDFSHFFISDFAESGIEEGRHVVRTGRLLPDESLKVSCKRKRRHFAPGFLETSVLSLGERPSILGRGKAR
jgi:hypothetical protein